VIQIATNLFSFVGLLCDIIGTSYGVAHITALQQDIRVSEWLESSGQRMEIIRRWRGANDPDPLGFPEALALLQQEVALRETITKHREVWKYRILHRDPHNISPIGSLRDLIRRRGTLAHLMHQFNRFINIRDHRRETLARLMHQFNRMRNPEQAMGIMFYGIMCLLFSVLYLSVGSQPPAVWFSCVALTALFVLTMLLSMFEGQPYIVSVAGHV
jgi:hypothetical protein